jgi:hypothetical protein
MPDALRLLTDEDAMSDYRFGKKSVHHLFCRQCGAHAFLTASPRTARRSPDKCTPRSRSAGIRIAGTSSLAPHEGPGVDRKILPRAFAFGVSVRLSE